MKGYIRTYEGDEYALPELFFWELRYTGGVPCDSFRLRCAYGAEMAGVLTKATRFLARENGETVFFGVIDEWSAECGEAGKELSVAGRGMAALLLDNESEPAVYDRATTAEILRRHVLPYGIVCRAWDELALGGYAVEGGGSEWRALSAFTRRAGGFLPYFERDGSLRLCAGRTRRTVALEDAEISALRYRDKRYGVLSEAVLIDRKTRARTSVKNEPFRARGGCCRRVLSVPHGTDASAEGKERIERSRDGAETLTVTAQGRLAADAGDAVCLDGCALGVAGTFRVAELVWRMDEAGETTVLTLERE